MQKNTFPNGASVDTLAAGGGRIDQEHVDWPAIEAALKRCRDYRAALHSSIDGLIDFDCQIDVAAPHFIVQSRPVQPHGRGGAEVFAHRVDDGPNLAL